MKKNKNKLGLFKSGFSLLEMIIVVIIIGILTSTMVPMFSTKKVKSKAAEKFANEILNIYSAEENYYLNEPVGESGKVKHKFTANYDALKDAGYLPEKIGKNPFYGTTPKLLVSGDGTKEFSIKFTVPKDVVGVFYNSIPNVHKVGSSGNKVILEVKGHIPGMEASLDNLLHRDSGVNQELRTVHGPVEISDNVKPENSKLYITDDIKTKPEYIKTNGHVNGNHGILIVGALKKEAGGKITYGLKGMGKDGNLYINSNRNNPSSSGNKGRIIIGDSNKTNDGSKEVTIGINDRELIDAVLDKTAEQVGVYFDNNKINAKKSDKKRIAFIGKTVYSNTSTDVNKNKFQLYGYNYNKNEGIVMETSEEHDIGTSMYSKKDNNNLIGQTKFIHRNNTTNDMKYAKYTTINNTNGNKEYINLTRFQKNGTYESYQEKVMSKIKYTSGKKKSNYRNVYHQSTGAKYTVGTYADTTNNGSSISSNIDIKISTNDNDKVNTFIGMQSSNDGTAKLGLYASDNGGTHKRNIVFSGYDKNGNKVYRYISMSNSNFPVISSLNSIWRIITVPIGGSVTALPEGKDTCAGGDGRWRWRILGVESEFLAPKSLEPGKVKTLVNYNYSYVNTHPYVETETASDGTIKPKADAKYYGATEIFKQLMDNQTYLQAVSQILSNSIMKAPINGGYDINDNDNGKTLEAYYKKDKGYNAYEINPSDPSKILASINVDPRGSNDNTDLRGTIYSMIFSVIGGYSYFYNTVANDSKLAKFSVFRPYGIGINTKQNGKLYKLNGYVFDQTSYNKYIRSDNFFVASYLLDLPKNLLGFINFLVKDPNDSNKYYAAGLARVLKHSYRIANTKNKKLIQYYENHGWQKYMLDNGQPYKITIYDPKNGGQEYFVFYKPHVSGYQYFPYVAGIKNNKAFAKKVVNLLKNGDSSGIFPIKGKFRLGLVCVPKTDAEKLNKSWIIEK